MFTSNYTFTHDYVYHLLYAVNCHVCLQFDALYSYENAYVGF